MKEGENEPLESVTQVEKKMSRREKRLSLKKSGNKKVLNEKITLKRVRIGNFEVRVSESKVEIEDVVKMLSKHVYSMMSFEGSLIAHLLSPMIKDEGSDGYRTKTESEIEEGVKNVDVLLVGLIYTNLIFSNHEFRADFFKLVGKYTNPKNANKISKKEDDAILDEIKTSEQIGRDVE